MDERKNSQFNFNQAPLSAAPKTGVTAKNNDTRTEGDAHNSRASEGGARANGSTKEFNNETRNARAPLSGAHLDVDDTRLYLFDVHDILLKERYTQKLVSDYKKLVGERVSREGGGSVLQIQISSVDNYAKALKQKAIEKHGDPTAHDKHASQNAIKPDDKIFGQLLEIARKKPYDVPIESDAQPAKAAPIETLVEDLSDKNETPSLQDKERGPAEPNALREQGAAEQNAPTSLVPREMYDQACQRGDEYKELLEKEQSARKHDQTTYTAEREGLLEDLGTAYDRIGNMNEILTNNVATQPLEVINALKAMIDPSNNPQKHEIIPAQQQENPQPDTSPQPPKLHNHSRKTNFENHNIKRP